MHRAVAGKMEEGSDHGWKVEPPIGHCPDFGLRIRKSDDFDVPNIFSIQLNNTRIS